jgi:hypothetical protein
MRPRDVRSLIGLPGYSEAQLKRVLEEEPKRTSATYDTKQSRYKTQSSQIANGGLYEVWEYHGDVNKEDMEMLDCGCDLDEVTVSACVVFINDRPVKAQLNTLDTGDLPYDFYQWTKLADEPWGMGLPNEMFWPQRVIDAAWRAMMDNAGDSAGVNVVIGDGLEPANGVWEITGKKIWRVDAETTLTDVRQAFAQFQVANNQDPLQKIIELSMRFVDIVTAMPTIFQGEAREIPETLGATNIMVDASNVSFRHRVKRYDDQVTRRHLHRYYDWNMQYNENPEIKGDFDVDPRGVKVLYEKDQQAQTLLQVFSLKADPDIARKTDWDKAIAQLYASKRLDILKDEAKLNAEQQAQQQAAQQGQQPAQNPALEVAKVRTDGDMKKAQLVQQSDMQELQFKAQQAQLDREHALKMQQITLQMKMMEFSEKNKIEIGKLKAQLALGSAGMNLQRELTEKNHAHENAKVPQVLTPPTEPPQRAPAGEAYQL